MRFYFAVILLAMVAVRFCAFWRRKKWTRWTFGAEVFAAILVAALPILLVVAGCAMEISEKVKSRIPEGLLQRARRANPPEPS